MCIRLWQGHRAGLRVALLPRQVVGVHQVRQGKQVADVNTVAAVKRLMEYWPQHVLLHQEGDHARRVSTSNTVLLSGQRALIALGVEQEADRAAQDRASPRSPECP